MALGVTHVILARDIKAIAQVISASCHMVLPRLSQLYGLWCRSGQLGFMASGVTWVISALWHLQCHLCHLSFMTFGIGSDHFGVMTSGVTRPSQLQDTSGLTRAISTSGH